MYYPNHEQTFFFNFIYHNGFFLDQQMHLKKKKKKEFYYINFYEDTLIEVQGSSGPWSDTGSTQQQKVCNHWLKPSEVECL